MSCGHPIHGTLAHAAVSVVNMRVCAISMAFPTGKSSYFQNKLHFNGVYLDVIKMSFETNSRQTNAHVVHIFIAFQIYREEVAWDIDTIYLSHDTRILNLRDFDHLEPK